MIVGGRVPDAHRENKAALERMFDDEGPQALAGVDEGSLIVITPVDESVAIVGVDPDVFAAHWAPHLSAGVREKVIALVTWAPAKAGHRWLVSIVEEGEIYIASAKIHAMAPGGEACAATTVSP